MDKKETITPEVEKTFGESASERITSTAAEEMRKSIVRTGGREVFFAGTLNSDGKISSVRVVARGNEGAVPALFEGLKSREVVIHNHPSSNVAPSEADLQLASIFSFQGHGVFIVDNEISRVYVVVEPQREQDEKKLDPETLCNLLTQGSRLSNELPRFEIRPQQYHMMAVVARAFNDQKIAVVEAPTGVGKTLAYLIPAVFWSRQNGERVIISTRTINLQEQIIYKDIPLLQKCLGVPFNAVLVKGRNNYLCRRRFARVVSEKDLFDTETNAQVLSALADWMEHTQDGSLADIPFVPPRDLWAEICSEADTCRGTTCPDIEKCFVNRARKAMAKADILVVNHHMLFSDLAIKRELGRFSALAVLPAYQRVIFDEAHSIEDSATEFFGEEISRFALLSVLGRIVRIEKQHERGLLPYLRIKLFREATSDNEEAVEKILSFIDHTLYPFVSVVREIVRDTFERIRSFVSQRTDLVGREVKLRLTPQILQEPELRSIYETHVLPTSEQLGRCAALCLDLIERVREIRAAEPSVKESSYISEILELQSYAERLKGMASFLSRVLNEDPPPTVVRWIEIDGKNANIVRLAECPIELGELLADWVYDNLKTAVMTSATLSVRQEFSFFKKRVGLSLINPEKCEFHILPTPFNFQTQALLCMLTNLVEPNDPHFLEESAQCMSEILSITKGHALILFTSFYALDHTYTKLEPFLKANGIMPLKQGDDTRTRLLDRFREDVSSVLFATDSFWEGVDVAGEALQCVIVTRLPFRVPTEPVLEARAEAIDAAGGNSFLEYTIPQAVIKFRQGFGRLIRRKTDRGSVIVLDKRITRKYYGKAFLESLPGIRMVQGSKETIFAALREFYT
ncbi:MAG TPA: helicase C-terminal domain-containing protein [Candidatus Hydrogenedentes bacterium]|nr:helicase C-terminal domain-containing protein [Candidatus Hydrogenedentota bacterium]HOL75531.1 helicase C-terminal domain-containing protein [Candidatus Hydrogenedentota bacterium]HPO86027.1 helicase C-terminal domain-containing protein [Candidatus Hydrogenedentota bacterium]